MQKNILNTTLSTKEHVALQRKFNEAVALHQNNLLEQAKVLYEEVLKLNPHHSDALHLLGLIFLSYKDFETSLELINQSIALNSQYATAYANRGVVLQELQRYEEALESYNSAIALNPNHADTYFKRGNVLRRVRRYEEALASYVQALRINPNHADILFHCGNILHVLHKHEEALKLYQKALSINPNHASVYSNLGNVFKALERYDEALKSYNQAIALQPRHADAHSNRGYLLQELKQYDEVLKSYDQAIIIDPNHSDAHWNKSLLWLLLGDFKQGFEEYEWRWTQESFTSLKRNFTQPLWLGVEDIKGKTILIYEEQGLGDTLQFCRYIEHVSRRGAQVIFEVREPLYHFLQHLNGVDQCILWGEPLPEFDYYCPLLSLPLAFKTTLTTIPNTPHLNVDALKVMYWQETLKHITKPKIGLVWSGGTVHKNDHHRSITLEMLLRYLPQEYDYISLQKELRQIDQPTLENSTNVHFFGNELHDFTDTAGLCACMDLVISVDTSVAHLAGSLNKETVILLPFAPDWRWLDNKEDTPWYPSAHLLRQTHINDWESCLANLTPFLQRTKLYM